MQQVTRPGPQPPACVVQDCYRPPAGPGEVYCKGHLRIMGDKGSAITPPIAEPDDPELLERERRKAEERERREYEDRRRVKEWETLPNGTRRPKEYYTDEELKALEAEEDRQVAQLAERIRHLPTNQVSTNETMRLVEESYDNIDELRRTYAAQQAPPEPNPEVWLGRNVSGEVRIVCDNELDALRWAVANTGKVTQVTLNEELP